MKYAMLLAVLVCGCSVTTEDASIQKNPCVTAGAAYEVTFVETSGTCGKLGSSVMIVPEDGIIQLPGCTLGPNQRYNGCSQYVDVHCSKVVDGTTYTSKMTGKFEWSKDGSSATGVQTITVSAPGKDSCTSTYSVWDKRL